MILDEVKLSDAKTKALIEKLGKLGLSDALIVGGGEIDTNFAKAAKNIAKIDVLPSQGANVYDILRRDTLVLTREAVETLEARLK
jgi:large subunit ribosomal protein L4